MTDGGVKNHGEDRDAHQHGDTAGHLPGSATDNIARLVAPGSAFVQGRGVPVAGYGRFLFVPDPEGRGPVCPPRRGCMERQRQLPLLSEIYSPG